MLSKSFRYWPLIASIGLCFQVSCSHKSPVDQENPSLAEVEIISPSRIDGRNVLPMVVRIKSQNGEIDVQKTERIQADLSGVSSLNQSISIKRGVGALTMIPPIAAQETEISFEGLSGSKKITISDTIQEKEFSGVINEELLIWDPSTNYIITDDLTIPATSTLIIEKGARIFLNQKVNVFVRGEISILGEADDPVLFASKNSNEPWGGLAIYGEPTFIKYCFFVNGGGDESRAFGHSNSQAVLYAENTDVIVDNGYFLDNPGKAVGTRGSRIALKNTIITRCDTGGEFVNSLAFLDHSYVLDIPNDDGAFVDDDNDGLYFSGVPSFTEEPSKVENSVIMTGKDDAIDHNGARLEVNNSWLEGFLHEGVAGSNANWVRVYNCVIKNCEQGVEAGYGEPEVFVDHCVIIENDVGLRVGDSYSHRGSFGKIWATNTILFNNDDNIRNFDLFVQAARDSALDIRHSMTNDSDYDHWPFCITGTPQFNENYFLLDHSPGKGQSDSGGDMGLKK